MRKRLLFFVLMLLSGYATLQAQSVVVNRFYNSATADGSYDAVELLVIKNHLDIRNFILKDYANSVGDDGGSKYRFAAHNLWSNLASGTTIVVRKTGVKDNPAYQQDTDPSDFKLDVLLSNTSLFIDLAPTKPFNLTSVEMVLIRADDGTGSAEGSANAVHAFAAGDMSSKALFNNLGCPKLNSVSGAGSASAAGFVYPTNLNVALSANDALISMPAYWARATELMEGFPVGLEVYKTSAPFNGKAMNAYALVFDPRVIDFKPVVAPAAKKVSAFYEDEPGVKYACINGGFFGSNTSYSLVQYRGVVSAINIKSLYRSVYNSTSNAYYPTRGAFGLTAYNVPAVSWVYHVGAGNGVVYSYPQPSPNDVNQAPQALPTAAFPAGGSVWNVTSAIGGSPVLIKNNQINITDAEELIDINNTTSRARSAIGHTADGKVVIVALEGNNPEGATGLNLAELALLMKEIGCTAAVNLDGGGSTSVTINGQNPIRPSDGTERPVVSAILLKSKI